MCLRRIETIEIRERVLQWCNESLNSALREDERGRQEIYKKNARNPRLVLQEFSLKQDRVNSTEAEFPHLHAHFFIYKTFQGGFYAAAREIF